MKTKNMKTYYGVVNTYNDRGIVNTNIISEKAEKKPENTFKETRRCDIYVDWFDTYEEAEQYSADALNA